ncbi:adenylate kinase [Peptoniphilus obesi]|uniref:adenylate kinase n=1 Tax=Peptoniphilus obesi TaxID=1472765 RepID=UPI0004ADF0B5|nr:adenylate kinase [Peptoniphilus obesi]
MKLVILGPPGAGKGTQAEFIINKYNIPHISTGDIFRENIKNNTDLGKEAKSYMDKGLLVPDEVVIKIVQERISRDDCKDGFLLDGFPRTVTQAVSLDAQLDKLNTKLDKVINIDVDQSILVDRAVGRRICKTCGATYHVKYNPPKVEGVCDKDNTPLIQRDDDVKETVENRIKVYLDQTVPLLDYYVAQELLVNVDGSKDIKEVSEEIVKGLEN